VIEGKKWVPTRLMLQFWFLILLWSGGGVQCIKWQPPTRAQYLAIDARLANFGLKLPDGEEWAVLFPRNRPFALGAREECARFVCTPRDERELNCDWTEASEHGSTAVLLHYDDALKRFSLQPVEYYPPSFTALEAFVDCVVDEEWPGQLDDNSYQQRAKRRTRLQPSVINK
jgi:hypothetical protein